MSDDGMLSLSSAGKVEDIPVTVDATPLPTEMVTPEPKPSAVPKRGRQPKKKTSVEQPAAQSVTLAPEQVKELTKDKGFVREVTHESNVRSIKESAKRNEDQRRAEIVNDPLTDDVFMAMVRDVENGRKSAPIPSAPRSPRARSKSPKRSAMKQSVEFEPGTQVSRTLVKSATSKEKMNQVKAIRMYQRYKNTYMHKPNVEWYFLSVDELLLMNTVEIYDEVQAMRAMCGDINKHSMIDQVLQAGAYSVEFASKKLNNPMIDLGNTAQSLRLSESIKSAYETDDEFVSILEELRIIAEAKVSNDPWTRLALKLSMIIITVNQENLQLKYNSTSGKQVFASAQDL